MPDVFLKRATYDEPALTDHVFELLDACGRDAIRRNARVLIKPNLLAPEPPGRAIVTHPLVVRAAVRYVIARGGRPLVADSPPLGVFSRVVKKSGLAEALAGLDVECRELLQSRTVDVGTPFQKIGIAEDALAADAVINLPKLKSHSQMLLTLGVKNLYGCVVGLTKAEWHYRTGVDREMFARLLVTVYGTVCPAVTLLDGILALEGDGPGTGGTPREIGVLMASADAVSLDETVCRMLGIPADDLLTNRVARQMGVTDGDARVIGELPAVEGFRFPEMVPLLFGPRPLHGFLRRHLVQRPCCDEKRCRLCGECWEICPAKAITRGKKAPHFDYDACIRCYCCVEVCPHGALRAAETLPGWIVRRYLIRS